MPDLMQFKRGPIINIDKARLVEGEPAYLYDKKMFCIGTGEGNIPTFFMNEKETKQLINALEGSLQEGIATNISSIAHLKTVATNLDAQVKANTQLIQTNLEYTKSELDKKMAKAKIKSSDLSTAYDSDKIGLANLRQEVISYINDNSSGNGVSVGKPIAPGSVGFDFLAVEVIKAIQDNDFGTFENPTLPIEAKAVPNSITTRALIHNSIGFDLLASEVVEFINNKDFGTYF